MNKQSGFINKEITIAIILGFGIGLVVTYGVWTANRSIAQKQSISPMPSEEHTTSQQVLSKTTTENTPTPSEASDSAQLNLTSPPHNQFTTASTQLITGSTIPGNIIVIMTDTGNTLVTPEKNGSFEDEISLVTGINYVTIYSISEQGQTQRKDFTIVRGQS